MISFLKKFGYDAAFCLLLLVFILFKLQDLATPYFWDELGVYVPGALRMKDAGTIGLLPACLEPLYSRGHPLVFVFSQALFFEIFGDGVMEGHSFSLILGVLTLIAFYLTSKDIFNSKVAFWSGLVLAVQPIFYAMSGVILPEMMLTLFTIPAIWGIIKERWFAYMVFGSLALLTKESAIVIPPVALLILFIEALRQKDFFTWHRLKLFTCACIPFMIYGAFLIIQKYQNGWFFFPEHIGYISLGEAVFDRIWDIVRDILFFQGRWITGVCFLAALALLAIYHKGNIVMTRPIIVSALFVLLCVLFATLNFYLTRYMLYAIPFIVLIGVYALAVLAERLKSAVPIISFYVVVVASVVLAIVNIDQEKEFNDTSDMSYQHIVELKKDAISWVEQQPWSDSAIDAGFPISPAILDRRYGYLSGPALKHSQETKDTARYGVFFRLDESESVYWSDRTFSIIKEFRGPFASVYVVKFE